MRYLLSILALVAVTGVVIAQDTAETPEAPPPGETPMTLDRLGNIVLAVDPDAQFSGAAIELTIDDIPIIVVADPIADRMRAMVPIRSAAGLDNEEMMRLMQANFDSALDARYAVAQGRLWATYIHPLKALEREQFLSGLIQTINIARTYGQTYSGGALTFGGGDSAGIYEDLLKELLDKGEAL